MGAGPVPIQITSQCEPQLGHGLENPSPGPRSPLTPLKIQEKNPSSLRMRGHSPLKLLKICKTTRDFWVFRNPLWFPIENKQDTVSQCSPPILKSGNYQPDILSYPCPWNGRQGAAVPEHQDFLVLLMLNKSWKLFAVTAGAGDFEGKSAENEFYILTG